MLSSILELQTLPKIMLADSYRDGTVWFRFKSADGLLAEVCIDGRKKSATYHRIFDKARHPNKPGSILLDLGSVEEGFIVSLVSHWLDSEEPWKSGLSEIGWEIVRDALVRIGDVSE